MKPYNRPQLTVYGTAKTLTQGFNPKNDKDMATLVADRNIPAHRDSCDIS
jgi:hypothetical protein